MLQRSYTQPIVVVGAILEQDGKILLVKEGQASARGRWNQPAGWIDMEEHPATAIQREVKEETGLDFEPTGLIGIYTLIKKEQDGLLRHVVKLIFRGTITGGNLVCDGEEILEQKWFTPEEINVMDETMLRDMDIKQEVTDYFSGKSTSLDLLRYTNTLHP